MKDFTSVTGTKESNNTASQGWNGIRQKNKWEPS